MKSATRARVLHGGCLPPPPELEMIELVQRQAQAMLEGPPSHHVLRCKTSSFVMHQRLHSRIEDFHNRGPPSTTPASQQSSFLLAAGEMGSQLGNVLGSGRSVST